MNHGLPNGSKIQLFLGRESKPKILDCMCELPPFAVQFSSSFAQEPIKRKTLLREQISTTINKRNGMCKAFFYCKMFSEFPVLFGPEKFRFGTIRQNKTHIQTDEIKIIQKKNSPKSHKMQSLYNSVLVSSPCLDDRIPYSIYNIHKCRYRNCKQKCPR